MRCKALKADPEHMEGAGAAKSRDTRLLELIQLTSDSGPLTIPVKYQSKVALVENYNDNHMFFIQESCSFELQQRFWFLDEFLEDLLAMPGDKPHSCHGSVQAKCNTQESLDYNIIESSFPVASDGKVDDVLSLKLSLEGNKKNMWSTEACPRFQRPRRPLSAYRSSIASLPRVPRIFPNLKVYIDEDAS